MKIDMQQIDKGIVRLVAGIVAMLVMITLIAFIPGKEVEVIEQPKKPAPKKVAPIVLEAPKPGSVEISHLLWLNADEYEVMQVKFKLTNTNAYPVSGISVVFKFYDAVGKDLDGHITKEFPDLMQAGEQKEYKDYVLGDYPKDTIKIAAEAVAVSRAKEE